MDLEDMPAKLEDEDRTIRLLMQRQQTWSRYGNRKVFCGGNIMIGPIRTWWWMLEVWTIIVACIFVSEYKDYHYGVTLTGMGIFAICMISCFFINFCDPGVLVKPTFSDAYRNAKEVSLMLRSGIHNPFRNVTVGDKVLKYSYCMRCHHFRPPETGHCYTCDSCIEHWDHHCPIFGGCVGRKNIVAFHVMCLSMALLWTFWLTCSVFATATVANAEKDVVLVLLRCKTLMVVAIGFMGAVICPMILSKTNFEKNMCVPKPKPYQTSNDFSGDWSTTAIPDISARSASARPAYESTTDYSSDLTSSESDPNDGSDGSNSESRSKTKK